MASLASRTMSAIFTPATSAIGRITNRIISCERSSVLPDAQGSSFRPERRTLELWPLVQRLILDLRAVSSKCNIQVVNQIPRSLTVFADAGLLSQVFQN